ncbi:UNVERIFIED_CONTAM: hypothetical protein Scaly_0477000 [Sesamum calycinum]|uniref:Reverse transcriptase domain-containing protein n=1 Tax=Sesamum calycinum TaxID=2727403 RepID=A0AAW2SFI8_9LAMI
MQTRSRARQIPVMDDAPEPQLNGVDQVPPHELSLPREQPPLNGQTVPLREQIPPHCAESSSHLVPPKETMIQLTQEALLALIHDASTRAAAQAMAQFAAEHPINPPPPSPRRSRELSSAPEEEEQRQEEVLREKAEKKRKSRERKKNANMCLRQDSHITPIECFQGRDINRGRATRTDHQRPRKMKDNPKRLKSDKYCRFHRDRGHTTEECHHLKNEIEKLIQRGHLRQYVNREQSRQPQETASTQHPNSDNLPTAGVIAVISGGPAGGDSANARKALVRAARRNNWQTPNQIHNINSDKQGEIAFGEQDLDPMRNQNNDALVISATLSNFWVKKVLVDSGSSADIIFYDAYVQLGVDNAQLRKRSTKMVKFLVVKAPSAYNIILGRPSLNLFPCDSVYIPHELKFPTSDGVGGSRGR